MKRELVLLTGAGLIILVGVAVVQFRSAPTAAPNAVGLAPERVEPIAWRTNLYAAHQESVQSDKPLLVLFDAAWCGHCQKLKTETLGQPRLRRHVNKAFIPVRLNFDEATEVAEVLEVTSLPCTIVLSPQADLLGRIDGYEQADAYLAALERSCRLQLEIGRRLAHAETSVSSQDRTH